MEIRPATPVDAPAIAALHVRTWRIAYRGILPAQLLDDLSVDLRTAAWRETLSETDPTVVAEDAGALIGFCALELPSREDDRALEVSALYVEPTRWRSGVGRALLAAALGALGEGRWDEVTLWVLRRNAQARAFYARSGFRLDGASDVHQASGMPIVRMRRGF